MTDEIRIYVADLAAYNNGILHGEWIDALREVEVIQREITAMLAVSPQEFSEEWAIHDHEEFFGANVSEYMGIDQVHTLACFIDEHGKLGANVLEYYVGDLEEAEKVITEQYCGCYSSLADYDQSFTEDASEVPDHLAPYIDYERMGRDMDMSGDVLAIETAHDEVHIFWPN